MLMAIQLLPHILMMNLINYLQLFKQVVDTHTMVRLTKVVLLLSY